MPWQWLSLFRRDRKEAHRAVFDLDQAVIAEEHSVEVLKDVAAIGKQKLEVLREVTKASKEFEDGEEGDEIMAELA